MAGQHPAIMRIAAVIAIVAENEVVILRDFILLDGIVGRDLTIRFI